MKKIERRRLNIWGRSGGRFGAASAIFAVRHVKKCGYEGRGWSCGQNHCCRLVSQQRKGGIMVATSSWTRRGHLKNALGLSCKEEVSIIVDGGLWGYLGPCPRGAALTTTSWCIDLEPRFGVFARYQQQAGGTYRFALWKSSYASRKCDTSMPLSKVAMCHGKQSYVWGWKEGKWEAREVASFGIWTGHMLV